MGGALRRQDRLRLAGQSVLSRLAALRANARIRLGFSDAATARIDLEAIRLPDFADAFRAFERVTALSEPWLFHHCLRTYTWGAMIAQVDQINWDHELLFVVSALHDIGLTASYKGKYPSCLCFGVEGEAHLLHEEAALDVTWARLRQIAPKATSEVLEQFARLGFKDQIVAAIKLQARARPKCRAAFLAGLGFPGLIRSAQLEHVPIQ